MNYRKLIFTLLLPAFFSVGAQATEKVEKKPDRKPQTAGAQFSCVLFEMNRQGKNGPELFSFAFRVPEAQERDLQVEAGNRVLTLLMRVTKLGGLQLRLKEHGRPTIVGTTTYQIEEIASFEFKFDRLRTAKEDPIRSYVVRCLP